MAGGINTERDAEIVKLRKLNRSFGDIARLLKLTPSTVKGVCYRAGLTNAGAE